MRGLPLPDLSGRWTGGLLALLAGVLAVLAFAPVSLFTAAPLALAVWFGLLVRVQGRPRRAAWFGWLFGLGFFGVGTSWIFNSLLVFGQAPLVVASVITVAFVLVMALYPALLSALAARFLPLHRMEGILALAGGLVLLELARSWLFSGFPWLLFGHATLDTPLASWLPLAGELGAGLMVALIAAGLVLAAGRRSRGVGVGLVAGVVVVSAALLPLQWTDPDGDPVRATLVQGNIDQERKWAPDGIRHSLEVYRDLTAEAGPADLVVWPETAIPALAREVDGMLEQVAADLPGEDAQLVTGLFDGHRDGDIHNAILIYPGGAAYHKRQLVPFGEYIPLREQLAWLDRLLMIPMSDLTPGGDDGRITLAGRTAGASICYESAYARHIRAALPEAGFLVNVSNDAWFGDSLAPAQHLQIARVRAVETGRPILRATNTGISALIDFDGRLIEGSPLFEPATVHGEIRPRSGITPAAAMGEGPAVLAALVLVVLGAAVGRRQARSGDPV